MSTEDLVELVREHRARWPLARIAADPVRFRGECERIAEAVRAGDADSCGGIGGVWLDMMFGDPVEAAVEESDTPRVASLVI